jgi:hypothetical protein
MFLEAKMQIPETPSQLEKLDLMLRLCDYADGRASWVPGGGEMGVKTRAACRLLHTSISQIVSNLICPILSRTTARELESFTMHE